MGLRIILTRDVLTLGSLPRTMKAQGRGAYIVASAKSDGHGERANKHGKAVEIFLQANIFLSFYLAYTMTTKGTGRQIVTFITLVSKHL